MTYSECPQEFDHLALGPASVVAIGIAEKRTVTTICGFDEHEVAVGKDFLTCLGKDADKGIVCGVQN